MRSGKRAVAITLILLVLLPGALILGARRASAYTGPDADELNGLLTRAAAACYAAEGRYPPDLGYLTEEYGVTYDKTRFHVFYQPQGANLTPVIDVIPAEEAAG